MTQEEAIAIAKKTALDQEWPWEEPIQAELRHPWFRKNEGKWNVRAYTFPFALKGPYVSIVIDDTTGEVVEKHCRNGRPR